MVTRSDTIQVTRTKYESTLGESSSVDIRGCREDQGKVKNEGRKGLKEFQEEGPLQTQQPRDSTQKRQGEVSSGEDTKVSVRCESNEDLQKGRVGTEESRSGNIGWYLRKSMNLSDSGFN